MRLNFFKQKKSRCLKFLAPILFMVAMFFLLPQPTHAAWETIITGIIGPIIIWVIGFLGDLLISLIHIMITVAQYNDFINSPAVAKTWIVIRDLCNLFFVVILLVIAFGTVLGSEKYNYKKYLIPLFLMAILINFSKTISGLIIDFCQVVMMQFVNGFRYAAAGNLTTAFGLDRMLSFMRELPSDLQEKMAVESFTSLLLALCMMIIAVVTTAVILVVFLARIVALWLLVMLSPVAFLANAAPGGEKYSKMWWDKFTNYAIAGPVLAFFLWVSFSIMAMNPANVSSVTGLTVPKNPSEISGFEKEKDNIVSVGISQVGSSDQVLSFCLSIAMLLASLAATKQLGVAGSSLAMAAKGKLEAAGKRVAKVGLGIGAVTLGGGWGLAALAGYRTAKGVGGAARDEIKAGAGQGWNYLTTNKVTRWAGLSKKAREEAAKRRQTRWQAWAGLKPERAEAREAQTDEEVRNLNAQNLTFTQLQNIVDRNPNNAKGRAAAKLLSGGGHVSNLDPTNPADVELINKMLKAFENMPKSLEEIKKNLAKQNPEMAYQTMFHNFRDKEDVDNFTAMVTKGDIKMDKAVINMSETSYDNLANKMGGKDKLGEVLVKSLDESELSSVWKNFSRARRDDTFGKIGSAGSTPLPNLFPTKEKRATYLRATGSAASYDPNDTSQMTELDQLIEDSKEEITKKLNAASFTGTMGEQLLEKLKGPLKNSELQAIAKRDRRTGEEMAKANNALLVTSGAGYEDEDDPSIANQTIATNVIEKNKRKAAREARELQVKLTGGDINNTYGFSVTTTTADIEKNKQFMKSIQEGKIAGKDLSKLDPAIISDGLKEVLAKELSSKHIRGIYSEDNDLLYNALKETIDRMATTDPEMRKKLDALERSEATA